MKVRVWAVDVGSGLGLGLRLRLELGIVRSRFLDETPSSTHPTVALTPNHLNPLILHPQTLTLTHGNHLTISPSLSI